MQMQTGFSPGVLGHSPGCALCAGKLCTTVAPRETFKCVIPLLFSLIKVIVPQPSIELRPWFTKERLFPLSFALGNWRGVGSSAH